MIKALDIWLPAHLRQRSRPPLTGPTHVMLSVCDHFEPFHGTDKRGAMERMALWQREWPKLIRNFKDADGRHPKHTFFYPIEQHDDDVVQALAELCKGSGGEAEIHLHHDNDTAENLHNTLELGKERFARLGLLSKDASGRLRYGFIHGNWALDNSHPEGRGCGVSNELDVLMQTGCYADFTMPSAPHRTQTRTINSIYYARSTGKPKSHDTGIPCSADRRPETNSLLMIQGPLGLNWERRKWGLLPRIENGDLTGTNPPLPDRLRIWLKLGIHVAGREDWMFIKLHTHGAIPQNSGALLGEPMRRFHEHLMQSMTAASPWRLHYVTARELVNIVHAAEDGHAGDPGRFRDYRYKRL